MAGIHAGRTCGAGWHPARRLLTAAVSSQSASWPIGNRPQLAKLPHSWALGLACRYAVLPATLPADRAGVQFYSAYPKAGSEFPGPLGYTKSGLRCPAGRLSNYCYGRKMSKEDCIEMTGTVVEKFPSGLFSVQIDQERIVLAHLAGKLRRNRIRVLAGDRVTIEMSPYDLTKGRITYRHK